MSTNKLEIFAKIEPDGATVKVIGRDAWALQKLLAAGQRGCTPIDQPAPRWSHYIFKLRGMGFIVETIHEPHAGPFPGTHARYVLRSKVSILQELGEAA